MLAFVHVEKAAGSSVHRILRRWYGGRSSPAETGTPLGVRLAELKRLGVYKPAVWLSRRLARSPRGAAGSGKRSG